MSRRPRPLLRAEVIYFYHYFSLMYDYFENKLWSPRYILGYVDISLLRALYYLLNVA